MHSPIRAYRIPGVASPSVKNSSWYTKIKRQQHTRRARAQQRQRHRPQPGARHRRNHRHKSDKRRTNAAGIHRRRHQPQLQPRRLRLMRRHRIRSSAQTPAPPAPPTPAPGSATPARVGSQPALPKSVPAPPQKSATAAPAPTPRAAALPPAAAAPCAPPPTAAETQSRSPKSPPAPRPRLKLRCPPKRNLLIQRRRLMLVRLDATRHTPRILDHRQASPKSSYSRTVSPAARLSVAAATQPSAPDASPSSPPQQYPPRMRKSITRFLPMLQQSFFLRRQSQQLEPLRFNSSQRLILLGLRLRLLQRALRFLRQKLPIAHTVLIARLHRLAHPRSPARSARCSARIGRYNLLLHPLRAAAPMRLQPLARDLPQIGRANSGARSANPPSVPVACAIKLSASFNLSSCCAALPYSMPTCTLLAQLSERTRLYTPSASTRRCRNRLSSTCGRPQPSFSDSRQSASPLLRSVLTVHNYHSRVSKSATSRSAGGSKSRHPPPPPNTSANPSPTSRLPSLPPKEDTDLLTIDADTPPALRQPLHASKATVVINYNGHTLRADRITYDDATGDLTLDGHVILTGGDNDEYIKASHGTYNLNTQTGSFYDVSGSVGLHAARRAPRLPDRQPLPLLRPHGRQDRPAQLRHLRRQSHLLPPPQPRLATLRRALLRSTAPKARAYNSTFRLLNVPILFLPYVTHPIDAEQRQSGILIPRRSPQLHQGHRHRRRSLPRPRPLRRPHPRPAVLLPARLLRVRHLPLPRHSATTSSPPTPAPCRTAASSLGSDILTDQGGQDVTAAFRQQVHLQDPRRRRRRIPQLLHLSRSLQRELQPGRLLRHHLRRSTLVNQQYGFSTAVRADRYQGLKRVAHPRSAARHQPGQQVRIFHAPSLDFTAVDHHLGTTPLLWSLTSSVAGLKRTQPNFVSSGIIERFDLRPELSLPLSGDGWHTMSSHRRARDRLLPQPRRPLPRRPAAHRAHRSPSTAPPSKSRSTSARPPSSATFKTRGPLRTIFGSEVRHTVEPQFIYRNVRGIDNFLGILRFDDVDVASTPTNSSTASPSTSSPAAPKPKPTDALHQPPQDAPQLAPPASLPDAAHRTSR